MLKLDRVVRGEAGAVARVQSNHQHLAAICSNKTNTKSDACTMAKHGLRTAAPERIVNDAAALALSVATMQKDLRSENGCPGNGRVQFETHETPPIIEYLELRDLLSGTSQAARCICSPLPWDSTPQVSVRE